MINRGINFCLFILLSAGASSEKEASILSSKPKNNIQQAIIILPAIILGWWGRCQRLDIYGLQETIPDARVVEDAR